MTNKAQFIKYYKLLPAHYNNIITSLKNHLINNKKYDLSGMKVNSFFNNIIGNYDYITIDVWMLKFFKHKKPSLNLGDYRLYSQYIKSIKRNIKKRYNLALDNAGLQAVIWEYQRGLEGLKYSNFSKHI